MTSFLRQVGWNLPHHHHHHHRQQQHSGNKKAATNRTSRRSTPPLLLPSCMAATFPQPELRDSLDMAKAIVCNENEHHRHRHHHHVDQHHQQEPAPPSAPQDEKPMVMGLHRTRSLFSMDSNLSPSLSSTSSMESAASSASTTEPVLASASTSSSDQEVLELDFTPDVRRCVGNSPLSPSFDHSSLRKVMEPHLRHARLLRERAVRNLRRRRPALEEEEQTEEDWVRKTSSGAMSSMGIPYTELRQERPFLFDEYAHPLHKMLSEVLHVSDLTQIHHLDEKELLQPLLDKEKRHAFHQTYDTFVTSFCIPLLHSMAMSKRVITHCGNSASGGGAGANNNIEIITYRYQAFPTIQISRPGSFCLPAPTCDAIQGHSLGCLTFFIPLTPCDGTNCLYTESHPGKEDWHPLTAKSFGLGYVFDGARCLHFDLENTTDQSRVSLVFRVLMYNNSSNSRRDDDENNSSLCPLPLVHDDYSARPGFYDEAVMGSARRLRSSLSSDAFVKKFGHRGLLDPDCRVGPPFA